MTGRAVVLRGDARHLPLPDDSVDLIVTSPPYFALRSYTDGGEHYAGQVGSEATPAEFIDALIDCTREWVRVLKPSGSLWVNLGDKYGRGSRTTSEPQNGVRTGSVPGRVRPTGHDKSLMGLPWRYAIRCIDDLGLILRAEVVWSKPNGLPESVTDRVRRSHETWFHFTREPRYYSAVDEIRESHTYPNDERWKRQAGGSYAQPMSGHINSGLNPLGKLPGSVWSIPSEPLRVPDHVGVDHFAAFPTEWPRRLIAGWSPRDVCTACGEGRRPAVGVDWSKVPHRMVERRALTDAEIARWCSDFADWCDARGITRRALDEAAGTSDMGGWWASRLPRRAAVPTPEQWSKLRASFDPPSQFDHHVYATQAVPVAEFAVGVGGEGTGRHRNREPGVRPTGYLSITDYLCACPDTTAPTTPGLVVDPFGGTGTTALVAKALDRVGITVDLSADYCRLARWRTTDPGELAKAMRVPKPEPVPDAQTSIFDVLDEEVPA